MTRTHTAETRAKISAGMTGNLNLRMPKGLFKKMTFDEREDYNVLRHKGGYSRNEVLAMIGRADLIEEGQGEISGPQSSAPVPREIGSEQATTNAQIQQRLYVRVADSRKVFGVHPATVYRWAKAGKLTIHKVGSVSLLRVSEVHTFIRDGGKAEGLGGGQ